MFPQARTSWSFFCCRVARFGAALGLGLAALAAPAEGQTRSISVAVLDFGPSSTGARAAATVRGIFLDKRSNEFALVDSDLARTAARGAGFEGSLNLSTEEAQNIGAAIGCEFYFIGDAQTLRRVPANGAAYFDSFAAVFLVSARTGRLVLWERPLERRDTAEEAENALLQSLSSDGSRHHFQVAVRRVLADESAQRESAAGKPESVIEVMSDDDGAQENKKVRPPRPFRRFKPPYPDTAASAEVEAVVDALVDIDVRGEVDKIEIARWAGYGLDQSVIDTVKQMHFFPAMRDGVAIPMRVLLRYNFRKPPK